MARKKARPQIALETPPNFKPFKDVKVWSHVEGYYAVYIPKALVTLMNIKLGEKAKVFFNLEKRQILLVFQK